MEESEIDVPACLARVRAGDEDASRTLLGYLRPLVLRIVRSHLPRRTSEEDLVQMAFIKVFTRLGQYRGEVPLEHWVSRVTVNTCLNQLSYEKVRPEIRHADLGVEEEAVVQQLATDTTEVSPELGFASRELVDRLLLLLSPADRLVINLMHLEEKSVEEVAQITGWSRALVKVRAFRARQKMKKELATIMKETVR
ncbi:MAG TPA: sigma-70 family RNA polymerase sigma factor [Candidatus Limnocylindria bacterium]|nr:sigma-70 family RNA polymerase sigma factor [Candidatus Limnocylindria bacterium]